MLLDTGKLRAYRKKNTAGNGEMPSYVYYRSAISYYGTKTVGMSRYWAAQQANAQIDTLVQMTPTEIYAGDAVYLEPFKQGDPAGWFRILQTQLIYDDFGQRRMDLTLRRIERLEFPIEEDEEE